MEIPDKLGIFSIHNTQSCIKQNLTKPVNMNNEPRPKFIDCQRCERIGKFYNTDPCGRNYIFAVAFLPLIIVTHATKIYSIQSVCRTIHKYIMYVCIHNAHILYEHWTLLVNYIFISYIILLFPIL